MTIVKTLLEDSLYLSLYDRAFQPAIETQMLTNALRVFNLLLDELRDKIPYTFEYRFDDVDDMEDTTFVAVDDLAYVINRVVFPLSALNLVRWRETAVVENLLGLPAVYWFDESTQTIHVYPRPNMPEYEFILNGRKALNPLGMEDELPANMPDYMQNFIIYEVAFRLAGEFNADWNDKKESTRQQLAKGLLSKIVTDVTPARDLVVTSSYGNAPPFPYFFYLCGGGR